MYSLKPQLPEQLSSAIKPGPATLVNGIKYALRDKILIHPPVSSKTSTGNIKDGGHRGNPQLFEIPQSTQTLPQILIQAVRKLIYPLILELANIQPRLGWYESLRFLLQLQSCYNQPIVGSEEVSTPVDPVVLDHSPATINVHRVNLFCLEYQVR